MLLALLVGCGDPFGGISSSGGRWSPTAEDRAFVDELYALYQPCCAKNGLDPSAIVGEWKDILLGKGFSRDAELRTACLAELRQRAGSANCAPLQADYRGACSRLFTEPSGSVAPGGTCMVNGDCAGRPHMITGCLQSSARSSCYQVQLGQLGDGPCTGSALVDGVVLLSASGPTTGYVCDPSAGLFCEPSSERCANRRLAGEACAAKDACVSFRCGDAGTCWPIVSAGQSCAAAVCDDASYCDSPQQICVSRAADGAACMVNHEECQGTCADHVCSPVTKAELATLQGACI